MPKTYLVTGAGRGIGLQLVRVLAARGEQVVATARRPDQARDLAAIAGVRVIPLDVADERSIRALAGEVRGQAIDVLINNAGVGGKTKKIDELPPAELRDVFMVNAFAPLLITSALLASLRASKGRTVVQITSQLASIANNTGGSTYAYRGSKAALNMLNRSLANELRPEGFTCVAIHPGWVRTDMGGPNADITVEHSVAEMLRVIDGLTPAASGTFLNYDGTPLPW